MSAVARAPAPAGDGGLDVLCRSILRNRFLPVPPPELGFVGDGDWLAIGVEFLRRFVVTGSLRPDERVLDIGCGNGRMALPLTQYLEDGTYQGLDVTAAGIEWCTATIAARYPAFRFGHLDLAHEIYNPEGTVAGAQLVLPVADASVDFIIMTSVLTHLPTAEVRRYAAEIARVLAPGGRLFATAFLLNPPARAGLAAGQGTFPFDVGKDAPELHADKASPMAAVAFDEDFFLSLFLASGLRRKRPALYGRWSGRSTPADTFQDIVVLEHA